MRSFEFALNKSGEQAFPEAKIPVYSTANSAGADFFAAEDIIIPSLWEMLKDEKEPKPTLIHTGIKANMNNDEVLELYNRSSNPGKKGLILANSVGVVDADYYGNKDNDGEIMFSFYNFTAHDVEIHVGDKIGQGIFKKFLHPEVNCIINDVERQGGFGSTN